MGDLTDSELNLWLHRSVPLILEWSSGFVHLQLGEYLLLVPRHYISHLRQQKSVLSLNLGAPLYTLSYQLGDFMCLPPTELSGARR